MTIKAIKFQRFYYDGGFDKDNKVIYDDLLIKDTKKNREIIEKMKYVIDHDYDENDEDFKEEDKGEVLNELVAELEQVDEIRIVDKIEIEW